MKKNTRQTYPLMQKDGGLAFVILMFSYILFSFFTQVILMALNIDTANPLFIIINSFVMPLAVLVVIIYLIKEKGQSIKVLSLNKFNKIHILTTFLLVCATFLGLGFINIVFAEFLEGAGVSVAPPNLSLNNLPEFIALTITMALFPAIFEELFFRGILLNCLKGEKLFVKVVTVGLCFALFHCSLSQLFYQFITGVLYCLLAILAKSIIPCIIAHFMNNFLVLLLTYLKVDIDLTNPLYIVIGLALLVGYSVICYFSLKGKKEQIPEKGIKFFYKPFGFIAIGICLILLISGLL